MNTTTPRRSDLVRQRRAKQASKRPARRNAPGTRHPAIKTPPVVARGVVPQSPRTKRRLRRRVEVPLRSGAELALPGVPILHPGWRLLSGTLSLLLAFTLWWLWNASAYQINDIVLEGAQRVTPQDVMTLIPLRGTPIFAVDAALLAAQVRQAFPEFYQPEVHIGLPGKITIHTVERQPVLVWEQGGKTLWVDMQGVGFPPRGDAPPEVVVKADAAPPLRTPAPAQILPSTFVEAALQVSYLAPEGIPLVYSSEHGLGWQDPLGWQVYFGRNLDDIEDKLRIYAAIVAYLQENDLHPMFVSLEYPQAPYYRLAP